MSFFSLSRSRSLGHYPYQNHGGGYYKRPHSTRGILGKIMDVLQGSRRHSRSGLEHVIFSDHHYSGHHHHSSSWS